jgi:hypothetical protein
MDIVGMNRYDSPVGIDRSHFLSAGPCVAESGQLCAEIAGHPLGIPPREVGAGQTARYVMQTRYTILPVALDPLGVLQKERSESQARLAKGRRYEEVCRLGEIQAYRGSRPFVERMLKN